jgi:hypothetical protein
LKEKSFPFGLQPLTGKVSIGFYGDEWFPTVGATFQTLPGIAEL